MRSVVVILSTFGGVRAVHAAALDAPTTYLPNNDYSNEQLRLLWDQVEPIVPASVTTTVSPTPEATPYASPGAIHPRVPAYLPELANAKWPEDFAWGVASAAFHVEGAAADEGKGPSVWDFLPHHWPSVDPTAIMDNTTGDVSANSYYLYNFSISWFRMFPFGSGPVNAQGVKHYDDFISDLVANDINPVATLFHWDTPLALFNSYGAWTSPDIVADYVHYAKWFTFNEPQYCNWRFSNYPYGSLLPSYSGIGKGGLRAQYLCGHYTLLAHAEVVDWYRNVFKGTKPVSFKNSANWIIANSNSAADAEAVQRVNYFNMGWFGGPWQDDGDYPESLRETLGDVLPKYTANQKALIKGSCDFYAIDAYTTYYAAASASGIAACAANRSDPNYPQCTITTSVQPDGFPIGPNADAGATWLYSTPFGVRPFLKFITKEYFPKVPSIVVSEFGFADPAEGSFNTLPQILWDLRRADYMQGFLDNILASRVLDGVNVTGAFAWAIYDNYEWNSGLGTKFGLQYLNLTSYERVPKASMFQFLNWFKQHSASANTTQSQYV